LRDKILEEIKLLADKYRVLNNILLALLSGLAGVVFGITQYKVILNFVTILVLIIGSFSIIVISIMIKRNNKKREYLISKLKDKKWNKKL